MKSDQQVWNKYLLSVEMQKQQGSNEFHISEDKFFIP